MYYDKECDIFRWDNTLPVKTSEGLYIPGRCKACGAQFTVELSVGVIVRCDGPDKHFYGVVDNPIKSTQGQREYGLHLKEE